MNISNRVTPRYITLLLSFMTVFLLFTQTPTDMTIDSFDDSIFEASCSCKTCVMGFMDDDWFVYRYNPNISPLLNRKNSVLRRDTYKWWRGLQPSSLRVNYTEVVDQMFSLFPDKDHYADAGPDRCRTCAVVGNSANLLGSHYGSLIDFHDVVIRINKGPTKGYEKDVGSKTTHRIMYPESAVDLDDSTHLVLFPFKIRDMQWLISTFTTGHITRTYTRVKSSIKAEENKVMILHPAFIKYVYEKWLLRHGRYPSTGFITIIFALHICDQGLQKNKNEGNYEAVVEKLFSLFPDNTQYSDASPKRCRTCAVIGNSGNLKGSRYGHLIDLHDFVIRINMGPTKGYETDVGSKTTHRFIYPESATDVGNSTYLVLTPFKVLDMEWLISAFTTKNITSTYKKVRPSVKANRRKVMILHPAFIKYVHEIWLLKRGKYPSTGSLGIIFALHVCDRVSTFGFGADQYGNWYHYFEKTSHKLRTGAHSGSFEFNTMMQLYLENKIQVMILHPGFIKYVHEIWLLKRGKYPSTGFLGIIFALHVCDRISTFRFGADQYGNWYHYFEKTSHKVCTGAHSGSFEFDTMMQLYLENLGVQRAIARVDIPQSLICLVNLKAV
ncbi:CMP-N-acetylneuraminate-beta-galactosamide-alpha-2,3-sialyltransferase 1-like protein [Labeo rohita]|uniref:CMP-N-acetylneuraminate-beta-galactosamide-alpha-2,3-sialyltransferase 2 n=1 Tax=Labeo rohita TaxID=84645 RepID=A0A498NHM5_LABRO|nr:CMP-N-acetylneuraminate-beta-galactosamide-alpha-2,3-sialyltransferase 1-like protein [Labeo rohita]